MILVFKSQVSRGMENFLMPVEMKTAPVSSAKKVVGSVTFPVFDEKNPAIGLQDVMSFDWKSAGYQGPEHAIVSLVNTQYATNLKNEVRSKANPKLTQERLGELVTVRMAMMAPQDLQALQAAGEGAILAKVEELKTQIRAEFDAKAKEAAAALASTEEEDND